jgi:7,8-dihydropterin-6-yl-methyl-4-(beta-D-ribofuranosyl)aminobenzene 5'-phosphate synthase
MRLKILFTDTARDRRCTCGWGLAVLINKTVLFDTGADPAALRQNMRALGVDPRAIRSVIISHDHWDHTGGLKYILSQNTSGVRVWGLQQFSPEFHALLAGTKAEFRDCAAPAQITKTIYSTGALSGPYKESLIHEHALILHTARGMSILTGCAHPGLVRIIRRAKKSFPHKKIDALIGGFHLKDASEKKISSFVRALTAFVPQRVMPMHCTGEAAVGAMAKAFARGFRSLAIGDSLIL